MLFRSDVTWTAPETVLWSMGEVSCAIICVCVPTLKPLISRSYKLWRRPHKAKEARRSRGSSERWRKQLSDETGNLETQPSVHSSANVDDNPLISEISLDGIIQKPSSCHLQDCEGGPHTLNNT